MAEISAALVKELRQATGAGMMDCKRALEETGGDLEAARTLLREKGMAQAGKRAGRETTEGKVAVRVASGLGTLVAIGCETEPVSNNDEFLAYVQRVLDAVERDGEQAVEALDGERVDLVAKLGENIVVVGAKRMEARDGELLAHYVHPPANKIGVLVKVRGEDEAAARMLAMHISFGAPTWARRDDVPDEIVEAERNVYLNSDELQGKPEQAREKIVEGMLNKRFFAAQPGGVLLDQPYIHDTGKSVAEALRESGLELVEFQRYSVAG
jgi:elongation factor Ts